VRESVFIIGLPFILGTEPSEIAKGRSLCPQGSAGRRWQKDNRRLAPLGDNAWASSASAQALQAHFLCLAHNPMILCDAELARVHGGRNAAELTRRAPRLEPEEKRLAKENLVRPRLVRTLQRCTGRSVKFIRWLPGATLSPASPRAGQRRPAPVLCGFAGEFWTPMRFFCLLLLCTSFICLFYGLP